jgi:hypothetical protein
MGRPEGTSPRPALDRDTENPGYEVQDVNVGGVVTFIAGLAGFLVVFFVFCFFMGKAINYALTKQDGQPTKNSLDLTQPGVETKSRGRQNLASNADMEQRQIAQMTQAFPTPRLQTDDGNQDLADLHAREDLLLNFYSSSDDLAPGAVRIPIDRAMQLIVQQGLPKPTATGQPGPLMAGENAPVIVAPLTDGFARTGYELDTIEARQQKLEFNRAEAQR